MVFFALMRKLCVLQTGMQAPVSTLIGNVRLITFLILTSECIEQSHAVELRMKAALAV